MLQFETNFVFVRPFLSRVTPRGVRRILKGGLHVGRGQLGGGCGRGMWPLPREARKPSGAVPFEDIISLRNQQGSTFS